MGCPGGEFADTLGSGARKREREQCGGARRSPLEKVIRPEYRHHKGHIPSRSLGNP